MSDPVPCTLDGDGERKSRTRKLVCNEGRNVCHLAVWSPCSGDYCVQLTWRSDFNGKVSMEMTGECDLHLGDIADNRALLKVEIHSSV